MRLDYKELGTDKKILITGCAGFIGYHLAKKLLDLGCEVTGYDNMNDYYDVTLKLERIRLLHEYKNYNYIQGDLVDAQLLKNVFRKVEPQIVVNLAAQAGVRYSIENPEAYMQSNIIGFFNILECCRNYPVYHLIYASSSSVYGANKKVPFSVEDRVDNPVSLYAATKKSNELMAHCYSKLYDIPSTGLRFFTVYGPMGRPDMAYFKFAEKIMKNETIQIYNNGDMLRDFTYIDDIVHGVKEILNNPPPKNEDEVSYKIYNIGNNHPVKLMDFIEYLEINLERKARKEYLPMQPGDVYQTFADVTELINDFEFKPDIDIKEGIKRFAKWFKEYYGY